MVLNFYLNCHPTHATNMPEPVTTTKPLTKKDFEHLFHKYYESLCHFANQYLQDVDLAQDICQRVFIALWEKRSEINLDLSIKSYLYTSVRNRSLNHIRDHKKYRSKILDIDCGDIDLWSEDEDQFSANELSKKIEISLGKLPEKCRQVFEMSRFKGLKNREIAEELGLALKTVEAHISKALRILKDQLKDYYWVVLFLLSTF